MFVLFQIMYVSNETPVSLYFSLQVPKTIYKMKSRPFMTSSKIDMWLLILYDFALGEGDYLNDFSDSAAHDICFLYPPELRMITPQTVL